MRTEGFEEIWTRWSSVSEKKNEKKNDAEPEMAYFPFQHKAGGTRRRALGALGARHETARRTRHERCNTAAWATIRQGTSATTRPSLPTTRPGVRTPGRAGAHLGVPFANRLCTWCT